MKFLDKFLKRKTRGAVKSPTEALEQGHLPCQECGFLLPLEKLQALKMVQCPSCQNISFVPLRVGHFWLFQPLGAGGMGSVYKAYHSEAPGELFAVKILPRNERANPALIMALLNEAQKAKIVGDHPCLVCCIASGYEDGEYFCATEFVLGESLQLKIEMHGRLPEKEVLKIALHILAAEQHIYNCGYLFRDLKPENVILNTEGYAIVFDYGLCVPLEDARTKMDEFVSGSPYYIPPERLWGTGEDAFSEIYSLGMVVYYALTGKTYYDATEAESLAKRHLSTVRVATSAKMKEFRPDLVAVLSKMIKQDPHERYQTFAECRTAIQGLLASMET
ncbi:MAG: hypothetical protein A3K19_28605 [Lentisphaerae bacterium RIFOXYB12_FULL_65_16]|nr:MAG: hypothetical protein A3K18_31950 [Lentisphaerae bacterium RIFOXYA12_64_32]OGV90900.1 MAG: hypothetical protein A3K19_28605 [Lentisphaerae bacterium RIFOXYB12_FULL_65_16]